MEEMRAAEFEILKCVHLHYFPEEFQSLTKAGVDVAHMKKTSGLRSLRSDHVSILVIEHCQLVSGHSGRECVLSLFREKLWIDKTSSAIRRVLSMLSASPTSSLRAENS